MKYRINKRMADLSLCSRREADVLIKAKKVRVNGKLAILGQTVQDTDKIEVDQKNQKKSYLAYYKGRGIITHSPKEDELDIIARLREDYQIQDVYPVGRLDKDSEGLMILTNDGRLTKPLLDPKLENQKEYLVTVDKNINNFFVNNMSRGVDIEGYLTKPATAEKVSDKVFKITLTEGKKHQIRRMCVALGFQVKSLKRIRIMNIKIGKLKPNQYRHIKGKELAILLESLGIKG